MKEADEEFRYDEEFSDGDIDSNDELDDTDPRLKVTRFEATKGFICW
jgi:hypothetical protein